jgi:hypothetical protein
MDPRAILDVEVKRKIPSSHWESNPRTTIIQPVAQCYTTELLAVRILNSWTQDGVVLYGQAHRDNKDYIHFAFS